MVLFSELANQDLDNIYDGLLKWERFQLERNTIINYVVDIVDICGKLDQLLFHKKARYKTHKKYGINVFSYKRNRNTTWYIIYNYDNSKNIITVNHIISNHTTLD